MRLYSNFDSLSQIRSKYFGDEAFEHVVMLLIGFENQIRNYPSAIAMQGLCVYRSSLENPNTDVEGHYRLRVVTGQIERHEKFYDHITESPNPYWTSLPQRQDQKKFDVNETTSVITLLGARPRLQLAIEERFNASSLEIKQVVTPESNTRIHWNFLYRPFLDREVQTQYQESCFLCGPGQISRCMSAALNHIQCEKTHQSTVTTPLWAMQGSVEPWSGRCSVIELPWWTDDPGVDGRLQPVPQPNEWIVAIRDGFDTLRVFRGSPPLLYCILDRLGAMDKTAYLLQSGDCLVCMVLEVVFGAERQLQKLFISTPIVGDGLQTLEFQLHSDRMSIQMGQGLQ